MRQVLLSIPIDGPWSLGPFQVPSFGFGIVLLLWMVVGAVWLYRNRQEMREPKLLAVPVGIWLAIAILIVIAPWWLQGKANTAIAVANQKLSDDPDSTDALMLRSHAWFEKREYAKAVEDLETV